MSHSLAVQKKMGAPMDVATEGRKLSLGAVIGGLVTLVTLVGGVLAIKQYVDQNPSDVNGTWIIETQIQKTSESHYQNMKLTYEVVLVQNGNTFKGTGEKTAEQDAGTVLRELIGKERTRINITGNISGSTIHADFVEHGKDRDSDGAFDWELKHGSGVGTFSSMAADSSGSSSLKRQ
jgi:hypothetical protein